MRKHYSMDGEGRAALIAEAKGRSVEEDLAWVDSLESGPYTPMGPVCHNGEDLARAFPQVPNDLSHDLYATIGSPVPALVWPRQEVEQSPTRSETTADEAPIKVLESASRFNVGDLVTVQEIEADNDYRSAGVAGALGAVLRLPLVDQRYYVYISKEQGGWFSPEALEPTTVHATMNELNPALVQQGRHYGATWAMDSSAAVEVSPAKPHMFKTGERVIVARKVERDSTGHWCFWPKFVETLGRYGVVLPLDLNDDGTHTIKVDLGGELGPRYFSPEALDLVTDKPAIAFKVGDTVKVARKVVTNSKGFDCHWSPDMNTSVGATQTVTHVELDSDMDSIPVRLDNAQWYSPEALDLVTAAE